MALESRAVEVEDLGRQVFHFLDIAGTCKLTFCANQILVHGRKVPVSEMTDKISQVTPDDVRRVAARVFSPDSGSKPTVVVMGHEDVGSSYGEQFLKYGLAGP